MRTTRNRFLILSVSFGLTIFAVVTAWFGCKYILSDRNKSSASGNFDITKIDSNIQRTFTVYNLRRENDSSGSLLLEAGPDGNYDNSIYKYNLNDQSLIKSAFADWRAARGKIADCREADTNRVINKQEYALTLQNKEIKTFGKYPFNFRTSASGKLYAVISVEGPIKYYSLPIPGMSGSSVGIEGKRYLELFSMPDGKPTSQPIETSFPEDNPSVNLCWSADDKFLVITRNDLTAQIVEIDRIVQASPTQSNN